MTVKCLTAWYTAYMTTNVKRNWLRAAVLGANDGIVSVAGIVVGVAGATTSRTAILVAGIAGLVAGALSMAVGEYVSVSSQKDTEKALLAKERQEIIDNPAEELKELAHMYQAKGLSPDVAKQVAKELTNHDVFTAHFNVELGINPDDLTNPWHAAVASTLAFSAGALVPLLAMIFSPESLRFPITFAAVVVALIVTGALSAQAGGASKRRATIRVLIGGIVAMVITFAIGRLVGYSGL